ncbi:MAG TPA: PEP/pyruvate-binding domain-containing protein [Acidimicrobiales bacterium]|nr:PEP/pyruvate-binding domain-containing protein [Acidimicrobiales bacterium]
MTGRTEIVSLLDASDTALLGSKAVGLGEALRAGLPVPPGVALSGATVEAVATGDQATIDEVRAAVGALETPLAVRSSAADEDGADASFAGQHLTVLNVPSLDQLVPALKEIWWSANSDSAISYRQRVGLFTRPSIGVVVQSLLDPESAGVMFTRNPVTGADERVVEAAWGLGEAVVAGLVIPDHFRIDRSGRVLERTAGRKQVAIRSTPDGGTFEEPVPPARSEQICLEDDQLAALAALATRCEEIYGPGRDVEWAFAGSTLYLLQCRAVTTTAGRVPVRRPSGVGGDAAGDRADALKPVQLFAGLDDEERTQVARLFKERRFTAGETVVREGTGGAALFLIDSGEATVVVGGDERSTLGPGDYFGEIALIDDGPRSATIVARSDLVCSGITYWDFRPLVEANGRIGWKLLQSMVRKLREAEHKERAVSHAGTPEPTR